MKTGSVQLETGYWCKYAQADLGKCVSAKWKDKQQHLFYDVKEL